MLSDKNFVQKRIKEQEEYILKVYSDHTINFARKEELVKSATGVLNYLYSKLNG